MVACPSYRLCSTRPSSRPIASELCSRGENHGLNWLLSVLKIIFLEIKFAKKAIVLCKKRALNWTTHSGKRLSKYRDEDFILIKVHEEVDHAVQVGEIEGEEKRQR